MSTYQKLATNKRLTTQSRFLITLRKEALKNIMGKEENAG